MTRRLVLTILVWLLATVAVCATLAAIFGGALVESIFSGSEETGEQAVLFRPLVFVAAPCTIGSLVLAVLLRNSNHGQ